MTPSKKESIRNTLQSFVESQSRTLELLEVLFAHIVDELGLDVVTFWRSRNTAELRPASQQQFRLDADRLQIAFHGKVCELGDTAFRLLRRIAKRPNAYVTYEDLFSDVWNGERSDNAVRSAIKRLRRALRKQGLDELADAIDGTKPGRYRLRIEP